MPEEARWGQRQAVGNAFGMFFVFLFSDTFLRVPFFGNGVDE